MATKKWNIANLISLYRIIAIPFLLIMIFLGQHDTFTILLIISLVSDIADGLIARIFNLQTELGARLDSIGDMGTYFTSIIAILVFEFQFLKDYYVLIGLIVFLYVVEVCIALMKFGKISSFHTLLCKITAYSQGIFLVSLFAIGFKSWLFYPAFAISVIAYIEEIAMVIMLPQNLSNIKGIKQAIILKRNYDQ